MNGRGELPCWAALGILACVVAVVLFAINYPTSPPEWSAWAAGAQAIASAVAIAWAGRQGVVLLKHERTMQHRAAIELAVDVLQVTYDHLIWVGDGRWWPGDILAQTATGKRYFTVEYLDSVEKLFDQVNLEHLSGSPSVEILVFARTRIWRIKELLAWIIANAEEVQTREENGVPRFNEQSEYIRNQITSLKSCLSQLIEQRDRVRSFRMPRF